jgi:2-oxoisovalerate dehydrogenase E2 component (dihydrolipoyl transacylase)
MTQFVFKLPDLGEGTVEAEIVGWRVKPGDTVTEDDVIVEVMTEKAAVEVPAPVSGRVVSTTGAPGDMVPVGAPLIVFDTEGGTGSAAAEPGKAAGADASGVSTTALGANAPRANAPVANAPNAVSAAAPTAAAMGANAPGTAAVSAPPASAATVTSDIPTTAAAATGRHSSSTRTAAKTISNRANRATNGHGGGERPSGRVATSPAIRRRAHEAGVDLTQLSGSGPNGRILREDLEAFVSSRSGPKLVRTTQARQRADSATAATEEIKVIGVRRLIAQRMSESKRNIPHFAYVEEMDVTELESLRRHLNTRLESDAPSFTYLPFLVAALVRVLSDFPQCNALYDAERGVIIRHRAVHVGVATQTPDGLKVPVVHNAQLLSLSELALEIRRVTEAARTNKATREELTGSTITVTSLGKLGGIASTPIINAPEVAILGVNRAVERPVVVEGAITIRRMMNLSSSFDHRFVDGHDAAAMVQALKERLEHPATIFI